jgi:rubrerythrin
MTTKSSGITRENWPEMREKFKKIFEQEQHHATQLRKEAQEELERLRSNPEQFTVSELYANYDKWVKTLSERNEEYWESEQDRATKVLDFLEWIVK